jgi:hypothetical protein
MKWAAVPVMGIALIVSLLIAYSWGGIFWTRVLSACLGFAACFHLHDGSLSSMRAGLVAQDSRVRHPPDLDSIYPRRRDGFICLPPMPFGYWSWTKMSRREGHTHLARSVGLSRGTELSPTARPFRKSFAWRRVLVALAAFLTASALFFGGLVLALVLLPFVYFGVDHTLVTYKLPGGHTLRVAQNREFDVADEVRCRLDGPQISHRSRFIAGIGAGTSPPRFTLHSTTNAQVYWITADTLPHTILYIVDLESRSFWPDFEGGEYTVATGERLLAIANSVESGYHLNTHGKWIGIDK